MNVGCQLDVDQCRCSIFFSIFLLDVGVDFCFPKYCDIDFDFLLYSIIAYYLLRSGQRQYRGAILRWPRLKHKFLI